jgi:polysaccharide chain length determinant protein (PEP-CTERM system associated)
MLPGRQYDVKDYAAIAWRRKWLIIIPAVLFLYGALIVCSRLPEIYQSEMLIQVVPQRIPDAYVRSTVTMRIEDRINSLAEQIVSRTELERLINQMDLYPAERSRLPMQDVVELMRNQVVVEPVRSRNRQDVDSFYIRFSYHDPNVVARVTERLGTLFIDVNSRDRENHAKATSNFLQSQLEDSRGRLEALEMKLKKFREENSGRLPTQLTFNMQAMQTAQLQAQAVVESLARDRDRKLMLERLYADSQQEVVLQPAPGGAPTQDGNGVMAGMVGTTAQQLAAARENLRRLELRLKAEHPDVIRAKRVIGDLEEKLAGETTADRKEGGLPAVTGETAEQANRRARLQQMRADIESLDRQIRFKETEERRIRETLADFQSRIEQVPGVESEWIALTRDYDTQQAAYRELLAKSDDAKLASELEQRQIGEQFRILDPARAPIRPTGVNRLQVNAVGTGIGFALGLLLAAIVEFRDRSFRHSKDVIDVLKLPVIALVPRILHPEDLRRRVRNRRLALATVVIGLVAGGYGFWVMQLWKHIV